MSMTDMGAALPLPIPSAELEQRLATRRSAPAQALIEPGPSPDQIARILELGARSPDHGKLFPWRFVVMGRDSRSALATDLQALAQRQPAPDKARAVLGKLTAAPTTVLVIYSPTPSQKVPPWEQQLSSGAVCMNLEHAANALGFSASWITDWYSYDAEATALYGVQEQERVAGFIHLGSLAEPPLERPRPDLTAKVEYRP